MDDSEFLEDLQLIKSSVIISTIPELETSKLILDVIARSKKKSPILVLTARQIEDAFELYNSGVDYVILPHFLGGKYAGNLIEMAKKDGKVYQKERMKELKTLKERLKKGKSHCNF